MAEGAPSILDLPPLRGNPFDLRPIEPSRAEYLVGRDKLVTEWREHLISQTPRMLLLVGDRGSGRTSLLNTLASTTSRRPYIGQFWPEGDDPVQGIIHELSVHFGGFEIPPTMQQTSDRMVEVLDKETGTLPLIAFDYPAKIDLNPILTRLSPLLQRLRALVVVVLTPSQLAGLDDEVLEMFDSPHHLQNLDERQIQVLSNRRIARSANQKWNIRPNLLQAIKQHSDGNPRRVIRLLRDLVDERHDPQEGGVLEQLTTWRAPPVQDSPPVVAAPDKPQPVAETMAEPETEPELEPVVENIEDITSYAQKEESDEEEYAEEEELDEEPDDLWGEEEEELGDEVAEPPTWNDEFEAPQDIWGVDDAPESASEDEESRFHQAELESESEPQEESTEEYHQFTEEPAFLYMEEGTEPPKSSRKGGNFGRLLGRTISANDRMPTTGDDTPITVADQHPSLVPKATKTPVREMAPESVEDENSAAKIDTSVRAGEEEHVFHDNHALWVVDSESMSTLPDPRAYKPPPQQPQPKVQEFETEWFVAEGEEEEALPDAEFEEDIEPSFEPEPEFEEVETEVPPTASQIHIPTIPTSPPAVAPQAISPPAPTPAPVQIPVSLGPTWEPDEPFNPIVLQTLTEAERMIVEASSIREVSPSDDELQARLEVGRSRLSQIYNGMRRKGLLSVRKQGRTRYFKLSEAAGQHLRGAPQGVV